MRTLTTRWALPVIILLIVATLLIIGLLLFTHHAIPRFAYDMFSI